jgi:hypothetical protein
MKKNEVNDKLFNFYEKYIFRKLKLSGYTNKLKSERKGALLLSMRKVAKPLFEHLFVKMGFKYFWLMSLEPVVNFPIAKEAVVKSFEWLLIQNQINIILS